jgi:hypothetical protein
MTGLPVKLAGDSGAVMHQLLSGRIAVTCPIVGDCVSKRPIWLGEAARPCAALPPMIQLARGICQPLCSFRFVRPVDRPCAWPPPTERHRARHGFERQPDPWRAGDERLEWPLPMHLLPPAVRVQPVRRPGALRPATRQRAQRRATSGPMPPSPCRASTSALKPNGSSMRSDCPPTRFCRTGSPTCSSARSVVLRTRSGGTTPTLPTRRQAGPSRAGW